MLRITCSAWVTRKLPISVGVIRPEPRAKTLCPIAASSLAIWGDSDDCERPSCLAARLTVCA
jgi:hypothetical protein